MLIISFLRLVNEICGAPQYLPTAPTAGNMRTRIEQHMVALWGMQAATADYFESRPKDREGRDTRPGWRDLARPGHSQRWYDIPKGTTEGCAKQHPDLTTTTHETERLRSPHI